MLLAARQRSITRSITGECVAMFNQRVAAMAQAVTPRPDQTAAWAQFERTVWVNASRASIRVLSQSFGQTSANRPPSSDSSIEDLLSPTRFYPRGAAKNREFIVVPNVTSSIRDKVSRRIHRMSDCCLGRAATSGCQSLPRVRLTSSAQVDARYAQDICDPARCGWRGCRHSQPLSRAYSH